MSFFTGGFGRCWTMLPGYSLAVLARHHSHSKRKGGQVRFTPEQTASLERRFREHKYLSPEDRRHLAAQLKLSDRQVFHTFFIFNNNENVLTEVEVYNTLLETPEINLCDLGVNCKTFIRKRHLFRYSTDTYFFV